MKRQKHCHASMEQLLGYHTPHWRVLRFVKKSLHALLPRMLLASEHNWRLFYKHVSIVSAACGLKLARSS